MADHLKEGKCEQCLAFYRQTEKRAKDDETVGGVAEEQEQLIRL